MTGTSPVELLAQAEGQSAQMSKITNDGAFLRQCNQPPRSTQPSIPAG